MQPSPGVYSRSTTSESVDANAPEAKAAAAPPKPSKRRLRPMQEAPEESEDLIETPPPVEKKACTATKSGIPIKHEPKTCKAELRSIPQPTAVGAKFSVPPSKSLQPPPKANHSGTAPMPDQPGVPHGHSISEPEAFLPKQALEAPQAAPTAEPAPAEAPEASLPKQALEAPQAAPTAKPAPAETSITPAQEPLAPPVAETPHAPSELSVNAAPLPKHTPSRAPANNKSVKKASIKESADESTTHTWPAAPTNTSKVGPSTPTAAPKLPSAKPPAPTKATAVPKPALEDSAPPAAKAKAAPVKQEIKIEKSMSEQAAALRKKPSMGPTCTKSEETKNSASPAAAAEATASQAPAAKQAHPAKASPAKASPAQDLTPKMAAAKAKASPANGSINPANDVRVRPEAEAW